MHFVKRITVKFWINENTLKLKLIFKMKGTHYTHLQIPSEDLLSGTIWSQQTTSQNPVEDSQSKSGKKLKSVEEFLGSNANLVNLNDLVTRPPPSSL